jgi:ribonucleotide reductase beta subunit family protein with ferritin-like domain
MMHLNDKLRNKLYNKTLNINIQDEYLLNPENNRLTIYPIQNNLIWEAYKKQQAAFWTAEEIDFSKDYNDFIKLNSNEQYFIKMILAFFSSSDTIVNINLLERFMNDVKIREALVAYSWQMMMENIHSETYSILIDTLCQDQEEKTFLF